MGLSGQYLPNTLLFSWFVLSLALLPHINIFSIFIYIESTWLDINRKSVCIHNEHGIVTQSVTSPIPKLSMILSAVHNSLHEQATKWIQFLFINKGQCISIYHVFETTSGDLIYQ
jgi:hypothetical protein